MKRYGNLYPKICSMNNIKRAHMNARKGKAHYYEVQMVNANEELYLSKIQDMLLNKTFKNSEYITFMKLDGIIYICFSGSKVLADQLEKYKDNLPFYTTINKIDKYYTFT